MSQAIDHEGGGGLNLAERIRRLANGRHTLDVAQFQFIGIADIRACYAERWPAKRERVVQVASHFIGCRMAADDVLISGADGFLLVFGGLVGAEADAAAREISRQLNTYFLGDPELNDIQLQSRHSTMSLSDFTAAFGKMIAESRAAPPVACQAAAAAPERKVATHFTPVWDAQRGALSTFFITPVDAGTGIPLHWDHASQRHADMDEAKLKASEAAMRQLFASGRKALVGVAVHVTSLKDAQSLTRLLTTLNAFDKELAHYRILRITGVEPGYPRIYLEDILRTLRPCAPHIALGLSLNDADIPSLLKMKPAAVGFALPPIAPGQMAQRAENLARIAVIAGQARREGVPLGIEGDIAPELAQTLVQSGVRHIASPRIWPLRPRLTAAETWPASQLRVSAPADSAA